MITAKSRKRPKHFAPSLFLDMRSTSMIISRNIIREIAFSFSVFIPLISEYALRTSPWHYGACCRTHLHICPESCGYPCARASFSALLPGLPLRWSCCKCMPKSLLPSLADARLFAYTTKKTVHLAGRYQILLEVIIKYQIERVLLNSFQSFL